ncbi:bactericidal permeability-increasing protein-like isoform X3 [Pleurodeles waltl]|uniref:bactericidal permeability-increasing protein-like isoform X3 n=1 Tax=Pleurodeles waltl TaxID=8319 RepID=UPI0037093C2E
MLQKTFWAAALLCTVLGSEASNPGLKGRITGKALEEVNKIGLDVLKSRLKEMTIPDQAGQYRMSWMMTAYYEVSGIQIQDLQIPESSMRFIPGKGIELSIKNTIMKITGRWTAKLWFMNPGGSFDVFVSGLSLSSVLGATRDDSGRPSVREGSCSTTIGELRVTFKDGMSWLYNLFRKSLERPLRDLLYSKSCAAVRKMITDLDQILRTMPVSVQIDQSAVFDYSLLEAPLITDQYSELDFKGEFYSSKHARDPNFSPAPFSMPDQTGQMLYFGLSESFFNSAAFAYFTSGVMQVNLTQNKIPLNSPILLKTDDFENLIPEDTVIKGQVMISGQKLNGSLDLDSFRLSLVHSDVGPLEVDTLQAMLSEVLQILVLPEVNKILSRGFLLPTINGLTLVNPSVTVLKGLVIFGADGHFSV